MGWKWCDEFRTELCERPLDVEQQIDPEGTDAPPCLSRFKEPKEHITQCCCLVPVCQHRLLPAKVVSQLQATNDKFPVHH